MIDTSNRRILRSFCHIHNPGPPLTSPNPEDLYEAGTIKRVERLHYATGGKEMRADLEIATRSPENASRVAVRLHDLFLRAATVSHLDILRQVERTVSNILRHRSDRKPLCL